MKEDGLVIQKYFYTTDEEQVFSLYLKVIGQTWPINKEQFYDVLIHQPPSESVASFISLSKGRVNGFISTQILGKRGSIVLLLFEPGAEFVGEKLLKKALEHFQINLVEEVQLGSGGYTYFWPGIPSNLPQFTSFFENQGWEYTENCVDMIRDLKNFQTNEQVFERSRQVDVSITALRPEEVQDLIAFEQQCFPSWERYFFETIKKERFNEVLIAKTKDGKIIGSVLVKKEDQVIWQQLLGSKIGTIGALGVIESMRNKGVGLALAARATAILKDLNVDISYLGWTWLVDWYGKLGYQVWREYKMSCKIL